MLIFCLYPNVLVCKIVMIFPFATNDQYHLEGTPRFCTSLRMCMIDVKGIIWLKVFISQFCNKFSFRQCGIFVQSFCTVLINGIANCIMIVFLNFQIPSFPFLQKCKLIAILQNEIYHQYWFLLQARTRLKRKSEIRFFISNCLKN